MASSISENDGKEKDTEETLVQGHREQSLELRDEARTEFT
jgi:hypothetical protein